MTIGFNEWRLSDGWSCDSRRRDCLLPEVSSQRTPSPISTNRRDNKKFDGPKKLCYCEWQRCHKRGDYDRRETELRMMENLNSIVQRGWRLRSDALFEFHVL